MENKILSTLSYGMYAIGVKGEKWPSASIANTVFQVSTDPIKIAVSINNTSYTYECIKKTNMFTVSVISEDTSGAVIGALGFNSGRTIDKLENINHKILQEGLPVIKEHMCCWFLCKVTDFVETFTHTVFIAEVVSGSEKYRSKPMSYNYYHEVIKGSAPPSAPTYRYVDILDPMDKYICSICAYIYNDPDCEFEDLPHDWICPVCGMPKSVFHIK